MRNALAMLILAIGGLAAVAVAQPVPTPAGWPVNQYPSTPPDARGICIVNTQNGYLPGVVYEAELIGQHDFIKWFERGFERVRMSSNTTGSWLVRAFLKGPGEGDHWVEIGPGEYYCRAFAIGTPVSMYVQSSRSFKTGWDKLCEFGVKPEQRHVTLLLSSNDSDRSNVSAAFAGLKLGFTSMTGAIHTSKCAFPAGTEVTHWN